MSKNAMAGAVTLCGVGLCMIGGALLMQNGQQAHAAVGSMPAAAAAVAATANAQAGPTVVWYGVSDAKGHPLWPNLEGKVFVRAWSDGTLEARVLYVSMPNVDTCVANPGSSPWLEPPYCGGGWKVISSSTEGFKATADINADELIDGADLASVLSNWGDAPRVPFPPSDCPLNLINP